MSKNTIKSVILAAIASLFFTACFLSTSSTTVKGYVRDGGGKPVADAEVSFGGTGATSKTTTDAKGFYTVTAQHRPAQMLYLTVKKTGYAMDEKVEFPSFAAPTDNKNIQLLETVRY